MMKAKSTKKVRAIDTIIKFQIDDGIESLTISGKDVLADVSMDSKANVTLFMNADPDKINEIKSEIPFVNIETLESGTETDKKKSVTLSQDLTKFALEIADNSKELANIIKSQSSIVVDLAGLTQKLLEISNKLLELENKNIEQDGRLNENDVRNNEQDTKLTMLETEQQRQAEKLDNIHQIYSIFNANSTDIFVKYRLERPSNSIILLNLYVDNQSTSFDFVSSTVITNDVFEYFLNFGFKLTIKQDNIIEIANNTGVPFYITGYVLNNPTGIIIQELDEVGEVIE